MLFRQVVGGGVSETLPYTPQVLGGAALFDNSASTAPWRVLVSEIPRP